MDEFNEREREASDLRKQREYQRGLAIYRDLWKEHQGRFNEWATWSYAKCAQKCGEHEEAERIARHCYERWPDFDMGRQVLAWSHYYRFFSEPLPQGQPRPRAYWEAAEEVITLCEKEPYSPYSPFVRIVFSVVKELERRQATKQAAERRIEWLRRLDPNRLSAVAESYVDSEGKRREQASDLENWYSHMSKALLDAGAFEACIELCEEALHRISELHYDNDVWFKSRVAKAKHGLGRPDEALADYKEIVLRKPEWHIHKEIALLAYQLGHHEEALRHGAEAALGHGPLPFKWELFLLMAVILRKTGKDDLARQHAHLAARIRHEEGWRIKGRANELFGEFEVSPEEGPEPKELARSLRRQWKQWTVEMLPRHEGVIDWVHNEKPFGFIKADGLADSVYFQVRSFEGEEALCTGGTRVRFCVKESYDARKKRMSTEAVKVKPIGS